MHNNQRYAVIVILVCNAVLISFLESLIPIPVPGVKLGLANIITIIAIAYLDIRDVMVIVCLRCLAVAFLSKGLFILIFSLTGGILSALVMWLLYQKFHQFFSLKGISVAGALMHNTAQILIASVIVKELIMVYYLPVLLISAVITGLITGHISELVIRELERKGILTNES
ncbi:MAG: Gx transporter family protein [Firmicutes bacterium]|nr:Gx transporter family protein [Bacillota bacterium]